MKTLMVSMETGTRLVILGNVVGAGQREREVRIDYISGEWTTFVMDDEENAVALLERLQKCIEGGRGFSNRWPEKNEG